MVIVMSTDASQADIERVLARLGEQNCVGELTVGVERTIVTVVGPTTPSLEEDVRTLPQVDSVVRLEKSYKLAGRESNPAGTTVEVGGVSVGGPELGLIAGPGSVESAAGVERATEAEDVADDLAHFAGRQRLERTVLGPQIQR